MVIHTNERFGVGIGRPSCPPIGRQAFHIPFIAHARAVHQHHSVGTTERPLALADGRRMMLFGTGGFEVWNFLARLIYVGDITTH